MRTVPRLAVLLIALAPAAVFAGSCALGSFNRVDALPVSQDAGTDVVNGTGGAGGTTDDGCKSAQFAPKPTVQNAGGDIDFVTALRVLRLDEQPNGLPIGIDMDGVCTCIEDGPSCKARFGAAPACDEAGGRDAAMGELFKAVGLLLAGGDLNDTYTASAEIGEWTVIVRVRDWNGKEDDDHVRVDLYLPRGFGAPPPAWDGSDKWPISAQSLVGGEGIGGGGGAGGTGAALANLDIDDAIYFDKNAYVSKSIVVASIPNSRIVMRGGQSGIELRLTGGGLQARIVDTPNGPALRDGQVVGRILVEDLFFALGSFRDDNGSPLCKDDIYYAVGKQGFCEQLDLLAAPGSPTQLCDAISFGAAFQADPAQLGEIRAIAPKIPGCAPGNDPNEDDCEEPPPGAGGGGGAGGGQL